METLVPTTLQPLDAAGDEFSSVIIEHVKNLLSDQKVRENAIKLVNKKVNIPLLSEDLEGRIFGLVYDMVGSALIEVLSGLKVK